MNNPTPMIEAEHFYLRAIERADYEQAMGAWLNDREVTRYLVRGTIPQNLEQRVQSYEQLLHSSTDIELAIVMKENDAVVGVAGLHGIQWVPRHAELRILIGNRQAWGKHIGREASQLLLAYGFEILNLQKILLGVNQANIRALRCYQAIGFVEEGVLRREVYRNGKYYDVVRMSMLVEEYRKQLDQWSTKPAIMRQLHHHD